MRRHAPDRTKHAARPARETASGASPLARVLGALGASVCALAATPCALAATIVAEKNCSVRIDEELRVGQKVFIVREQGGRVRKVAIVRVSRVANGFSLGKVEKKSGACSALKGLSVQAPGAGAGVAARGPAKGLGLLPALDADAQFQYVMFSGTGLHQRTDEPVPGLSLFGLGLQADVWPGLFVDRTNFGLSTFGFGLRYSYAFAYPEIDVTPPSDAQDKTKGAQQTNPSTLIIDVAGRFPYMDGKLVTEGRLGYLVWHSLKHTLSKKGGLPRVPLRYTEYSGPVLGLKQRARLMDPVRVNFGFTFPFLLSGTTDSTSERTSSRAAVYDGTLKDPLAYIIDLSVDGLLGKFKGTAGLTYESWSGAVDLAEGQGSLPISETYITLFMGAGVFL